MLQDYIDAEIFADFIIEAKEHLETIEPNLLELEKDPENASLLNEVFRPMHSLKGASGFLGLTRMNGLAHKAENVLAALRKGSLTLNAEIMDVILAATDALRLMVNTLEATNSEGDADISLLLAALDASMAGDGSSSSAVPVAPAAPAAPVASVMVSAPAVPAAPSAGTSFAVCTPSFSPAGAVSQAGDVEAWINTREPVLAYALTAFGEEHLRDFEEEAHENISYLVNGLLDLEKNPHAISPESQEDLVNDLFRYFHNLKGNSGIIGFHELNSLTHEAETLLNAVRKGEYAVSSALTDLLLLAVDVLEALVCRIDSSSGTVRAFDISELLEKMQQAVAGDVVELPASLFEEVLPQDSAKSATVQTVDTSTSPPLPPVPDEEDIAMFTGTIALQMANIGKALTEMRADGSNHEFANAMYRSLIAVQNSCGFMQLKDIKEYAQRTAAFVDKGRTAGQDFSEIASTLEQECTALRTMIDEAVVRMKGDPAHQAAINSLARVLTPAVSDIPAPAVSAASAAPIARPVAASVPFASAATAEPAASTPAVTSSALASAAPADKGTPIRQEESSSKASSTIRVEYEKLDHLMNLIGELIINRNRYTLLARQLEGIQMPQVSAIAQNLSETTHAMARLADELQDTIMKVRMVPIASVFSRFPRLVRDLSHKSGKDVALIMSGEDTELDKSVVEIIGDPLVHLIRNSVDHGIEPESVRKECRKPAQGTIWLRAYYKGNSVIIEIEDDGKGIDPEKIREVAVRKGVISPDEAREMNDRDAMELIFAPGFSSAEVVTDISGRGVGMDVVRTNIKNLKGSISIASEVGKGTKFTLSLPLTLAIIDALMVNVADETYAIPLDAVLETTKMEATHLVDVKGRKAVTLRGEVLGVVSLCELLGLPCHMHEQSVISIVVIQNNERRIGLVVDKLLERQEIVIKPLTSLLGEVKGVSGATIMGDGNVILILDPHEIYSLATAKVV